MTVAERQVAVLKDWIAREQEYIAEEGAADAVLVLLQKTLARVESGHSLTEDEVAVLGMELYDASMASNPDAVCGDTHSADELEHQLKCTLWRYQPVSETARADGTLDVVLLDTQTGVQWRCEGVQFMDWDMANDDDEWPEEDLRESGWERVDEPVHPDLEIFEE